MGNPLDKIREIVDKVVPNEIKGYLGTAAAVGLPALGGGMAGGFAQSFLTDILMQKLLYDEDANKDTDYLKAVTSGAIGGAKNIESGFLGNRDPVTREINIEKAGIIKNPKFGQTSLTEAEYIANQTAAGYKNISPSDYANYKKGFTNQPKFLADPGIKTNKNLLTRLNDGTATVSKTGKGNYFASDFRKSIADAATPFQYEGITASNTPLMDIAKETGSSIGILQAGNTPSQVRDASKALEAAEDRYKQYIADQKAKYGADFEEDRQTRIAAYKQYMGLAGYSEDEIDDALRVAGYIGDEETAYAANGGRIGFSHGSNYQISDYEGSIYDRFPEAQVGTFINEERYTSEKIDKLEKKMNDLYNMRLQKRKGEDFPQKSFMEEVIEKEILNLGAEREKRAGQKTRQEAMDQAAAESEAAAERRAQQQQAAYLDMFGDGLNRTGRAMGGIMRPNYNMGGMMRQNYNMGGIMRQNFNMGGTHTMPDGSIMEGAMHQDRPNFNYGSGRQTPQGDPIAPNVPPGMQMDLRPGGFIELGTEPRADDVPAMVGKDEFVLNDRAVAGIGKLITGQPDARAGARALYDLQNQMEATV